MSKGLGNGNARFVKVSGNGGDRLGIVNTIADVITSAGGNVILQRSSQVAGDFALTMVASFDPDNEAGLEATLNTLRRNSLGNDYVVLAREITMATFAPRDGDGVAHVVTVSGLDRRGIVAEMTSYLLRKGINLDAMDCEVTFDSESGTPRFVSTFEISVPTNFDVSALEAELAQAQRPNGDLEVHATPKTELSS